MQVCVIITTDLKITYGFERVNMPNKAKAENQTPKGEYRKAERNENKTDRIGGLCT